MIETPTATEVVFEGTPGDASPLRLHVGGTGFVSRALELRAVVGDVPVRQIRTWLGEDGFTGVLDRAPDEGAVLSICWSDDAEFVATTLVFHSTEIL